MSFSPDWLGLREPADAAARAEDLLADVPGDRPLVVHDLGCGTGSMGRWLAGRLPGPQHWVLYDRDPGLLAHAAASMADTAADGAPVTAETREADIGALTAADLAGATLVTASALLDILTRPQLDRLVAAIVEAGCPALLTLSVVGRVELTPPDPLDADVEAAFNAHQRRAGLLGPDAAAAAVEAFERLGATVRVADSPWRLGPADRALTSEWLAGWVGAAVEEKPELPAAAYLRRRLGSDVRAVVHHQDLLAR
jgi:SAM-dependent methyltransferase